MVYCKHHLDVLGLIRSIRLLSQGDFIRILLVITELWQGEQVVYRVPRVRLWSWTSSLQRISSLAVFVPPVSRFSFSQTKFIFLTLWHKTTNIIVAFASNSDLELNGITIYDHLRGRKWYQNRHSGEC